MMMKKRLLALALCLVMVSSLLPITAAAYTEAEMLSWVHGITDNGTYCGDTYITVDDSHGFWVSLDIDSVVKHPEAPWKWTLDAGLGTIKVRLRFWDPSTLDPSTWDPSTWDPNAYTKEFYYDITINRDHNWSAWTSNGNGTHSRTCRNGCVDSPQIKPCADSNADHNCDVCNGCIHGWNFKAAGNTLTGHCPFCGKDVTLTLKADSVTLPNSPFNARLEGWEAFKKAVPSATYDPNSFDYKLNGEPVTDKSNPKAGNYQAGILISNLPGTVENADAAARANMNSVYLYTQYTAADPKVTAQTGDDRPIEIMLVSALAFSALAAAAFLVDSKRKYRPS